MRLHELETPTLVIDVEKMEGNLRHAAEFARARGVSLRPHTKTHKSAELARRQVELGAGGITVAKVGEAEVMAAEGLRDILIAHEVVGRAKVERLRALVRQGVRLAVGCDGLEQAQGYSEVFAGEPTPLDLMIEVDTGQNRAGVSPGAPVVELARAAAALPGVRVRGIFTHEGHTYGAADAAGVREICRQVQEQMVLSADLLKRELGLTPEVSVGSSPSLLAECQFLPGVTEFRPGTYIFNDLGMAGVLGHLDRCAVTILATVVGKPGTDRVILDSGAKTLTTDTRMTGVTATPNGHGYVVGKDAYIARLSEEHGVVVTKHQDRFTVGEKVRVIPNHVCVTVNLAQQVVLAQGDEVVKRLTVNGKGLLQ